MRWPQTKRTANEGVIHVESVVNDHGSIFRSVPQETDVGINGYIELVHQQNALGRLIAVQIKSGQSYVAKSGNGFTVAVDSDQFEYWKSYLLPVILVCYSPAQRIAAWTSIRQYAAHHEYHHPGLPITHVDIPFRSHLTSTPLTPAFQDLSKSKLTVVRWCTVRTSACQRTRHRISFRD